VDFLRVSQPPLLAALPFSELGLVSAKDPGCVKTPQKLTRLSCFLSCN